MDEDLLSDIDVKASLKAEENRNHRQAECFEGTDLLFAFCKTNMFTTFGEWRRLFAQGGVKLMGFQCTPEMKLITGTYTFKLGKFKSITVTVKEVK